MNDRHGFAGAMTILGLAFVAEAHLEAGSLSIKGNEKFTVGQTVTVKWTVDVSHSPGKFDLKLSTNGGSSFELTDTVAFPLSSGERSFAWTVPNKPSTTAQFQVCQHSGTNRCEYALKSNNFTIETGTSIRSAPAPEAGSLAYDARTRNLEVSFTLAAEGEVLVQAFDAGGRLLATLLEGRRPAGSHRVSVFSNRLEADAPVVFRLTAGGKTLSQAAPAVRP